MTDNIITKTIKNLESASAGVEKLGSLDPDQAKAAQWQLYDMIEWLRELMERTRRPA